MPIVSTALAKAHMRVDHTLDDELIGLYIGSAEAAVENYIGKKLADINPLPDDIKHAVLRLTSFFYEFREAVSFGSAPSVMPFGVISTLNAYREEWFHTSQEAENAE